MPLEDGRLRRGCSSTNELIRCGVSLARARSLHLKLHNALIGMAHLVFSVLVLLRSLAEQKYNSTRQWYDDCGRSAFFDLSGYGSRWKDDDAIH